MSWNITATGTKDAVRSHVADARIHDDQAQGEAAKAFIGQVLDQVPTNGVVVEASGHHDAYGANLTVNVRSITLVLDQPNEAPLGDGGRVGQVQLPAGVSAPEASQGAQA